MKRMDVGALKSVAQPDRDWVSLILIGLAVPFAILGWAWVVMPALIVSAVASAHCTSELASARATTNSGRWQLALAIGGFGLPALTLLRLLVLLLLGSRIWNDSDIAIPVILAGALIALMIVPARVASYALANRMTATVLSRNLPTKEIPLPSVTAKYLASGLPLAAPELLIIISGSLTHNAPLIIWVVGTVALIMLAALAAVTIVSIKTVGNPYRAAGLAAIRSAIQELNPRVCLYIGDGNVASLYQVRMWLATMERIREPAIIVMRSNEQFEALGPTSTPAISVPLATAFLALDLSSLRVGLYVANTGDVIHLIREPKAMSAFIGHGDSDKNSSFNPYVKVYDEIWLAGEAGAQRYRRAQIGVRDHQFVFVGRPQLDEIKAVDDNIGHPGIPTILYAPTWEGWNTEQQYTSLLGQGERFVKAVLSSPTPIRLIYKPHPYTGRRAAEARAANRRIVELLAKANEAAGTSKQPSQRLPAARRDAMTSMSAIAAADLLEQFGSDFWGEVANGAHVLVEGGDVGLESCFNAADLLVSDVSSLISDFVASNKPFAVFNTSDLDNRAFARNFPSTSAGIIISKDGAGIDEVIKLATGQLPDTNADSRALMRGDLLGPQSPPATARFVDAVTALVASAEKRNAARARSVL